ncbi:MAG: YajG family lipoprotein [Phenylobacterium sp.]
MRILAVILCAASLAACATTEDVVPIPYAAAAHAPVAGADQVNVTVKAVDARTTNRGRISTKINGYGMEMAAIRAQGEISDVVDHALTSELQARGYRLGAGGPTVNAAVETFYAKFGVGILAGKAEGDVRLNVTVTDRGGAERYRGSVSGASSKSVQLAGGKNAAAAISAALADALGKLFGEPAFVAALR